MDDETGLHTFRRLPVWGADSADCDQFDRTVLPSDHFCAADLISRCGHLLRSDALPCAAGEVYGGYGAKCDWLNDIAVFDDLEPVPVHLADSCDCTGWWSPQVNFYTCIMPNFSFKIW